MKSGSGTIPLRLRAFAAGLAIVLACVAQHAPATELAVTNCADDGSAGSLRSVIAGAASGDVVDMRALDCGVIQLAASELVVPVADLSRAGPGADRSRSKPTVAARRA